MPVLSQQSIVNGDALVIAIQKQPVYGGLLVNCSEETQLCIGRLASVRLLTGSGSAKISPAHTGLCRPIAEWVSDSVLSR